MDCNAGWDSYRKVCWRLSVAKLSRLCYESWLLKPHERYKDNINCESKNNFEFFLRLLLRLRSINISAFDYYPSNSNVLKRASARRNNSSVKLRSVCLTWSHSLSYTCYMYSTDITICLNSCRDKGLFGSCAWWRLSCSAYPRRRWPWNARGSPYCGQCKASRTWGITNLDRSSIQYQGRNENEYKET